MLMKWILAIAIFGVIGGIFGLMTVVSSDMNAAIAKKQAYQKWLYDECIKDKQPTYYCAEFSRGHIHEAPPVK